MGREGKVKDGKIQYVRQIAASLSSSHASGCVPLTERNCEANRNGRYKLSSKWT